MELKATAYSGPPAWADLLTGRPDMDLAWSEPLARHTTFRVGGPVRCLARPLSEAAFIDLIRGAREYSVPFVLLGGGSNVLAPDGPWEVVAIQPHAALGDIRTASEGEGTFTVGAGVRLSRWVRFCAQNGLSGSECLVGIPGTIGGALVMNAGSGEGCIADSLVWIDVLDACGNRRRIPRSELAVSYRSMGIPVQWVVLGACLKVQRGKRGDLRARMAERMLRRKHTQPLGQPSAGCIFKNPPGALSAGALIDRAGLKGACLGGAQVSVKHANWIINTGRATAGDILGLIEHVESTVSEHFGIRLEREIRILQHEEEK